MGYQLVPALTALRAQLNVQFPHRDRSSDGWVGDTSHKARRSDHNPDSLGWVHAIDVDRDGIQPHHLVEVAIKDKRCSYVIFERTIWSRTHNFRARRYTGANPHDKHVHISAVHGDTAMQGHLWALSVQPNIVIVPAVLQRATPAMPPIARSAQVINEPVAELQRVLNRFGANLAIDGEWGPQSVAAANRFTVRRGSKGPVVHAVQGQLDRRGWKITVDGDFGPGTEKVVRSFQAEKRLGADGIVGAHTWHALWTAPR